MAIIRDYVARIFFSDTHTSENVAILARDRYHATAVIEELYPEATVQMVIQQGEW